MHQPLKPVCEQFLQSIPGIFPGIDRVVMIATEADGAIGGQELVRNGTNYRLRALILDGFNNSPFEGKEKSSYLWLHPNELPFDKKKEANSSYHLFSEEQYLVLCLRIETKASCVDSFYLFFREDQSNFGISRLQGSLDTARKALIGSVVIKMTRAFYQSAYKYDEYIRLFTSVTKELLEGNLEGVSAHSLQWTADWADDFLKTYPLQPPGKWVVQSESLEKLSKATDYASAKTALTNAAQVSSMLYAHSDDWLILPSFISLEKSKEKSVRVADTPPIAGESRMSKAKTWLDNVEEATEKIISMGEEPTGSAVGQLLERPVSAPAITDWLRINQRRVVLLLDKHPAKWPLIREHFRPLTNTVERELKMRQTG